MAELNETLTSRNSTDLDLGRLERLRLTPRRRFSGRMRGERISRQKGISVEFADYRDYASGDDLRHLDWSILARLDRATIRTYQDEDDLAIYVILDTSISMDFGDPTKFSVAQKLAVALGFVGLAAQDAVYPISLGGLGGRARALRGRVSYGALNRWASAAKPDAKRGLSASLTQFAHSALYRPGMAILLTDGLDPNAGTAIRAVGARGHEIVVIQVLSPIELDPELEGDLRLIDSESEQTIEITAHAEALSIYKQNLAAHCRAIEEAATKAGGRCARIVVGMHVMDFVARDLRRIGLVE